jgi:RNA polymerase sigma-70 factor (ECF subfamily)
MMSGRPFPQDGNLSPSGHSVLVNPMTARQEPIGSPSVSSLTDEEVVSRIRGGDTPLFEVLMRRYNRRLYRVARSIVGDDAEAEDVMQQAYVNAYVNLGQFAQRARFSTWLTKIAVYEALARMKRRRRAALDPLPENEEDGAMLRSQAPDAEHRVYEQEMQGFVESAIEALPEVYRTTFVLREIEGLSVSEVAACLEITPDTVKTRLHRARARLRDELCRRVRTGADDVFPFHLSRCDRVVAAVMGQLPPSS